MIRGFGLTRLAPSLVIPLSALSALVAIGYGLLLVAPVNPPPMGVDISSPILPTIYPVAPEPRDRFMYLTLVLMLPFVLLGAALATRRFRAPAVASGPVVGLLIVAALGVAAVQGAFPAAGALIQNGQWLLTLACVASAALLVAFQRPLLANDRALLWLEFLASAVILFGLRFRTLHSIVYGGAFTSHFEAIIFSPVRIASGGTCLADVIPQYGCYGEYIAPLLRIFGTSPEAITLVFLALQITAVWTVLNFARSVIRAPTWLLACFLCLFIECVLNLWPSGNDPILQYYPIRFLFPALCLPVIGWLQRGFAWRRAAVVGAFAGAAITWNLESGLAVAIALALFVTFGNFAEPAWTSRKNAMSAVTRGLAFAVAFATYVALFFLYLFAKSGGTIDIANYVVFQVVFYLTGFGMIPMPPFPDYWSLHAALIVSVLTFAAMSLGRGAVRDRALENVAFLAVLAIGLSLYYTGRSHWLVLKLVAWPDAILFFFLADRFLREPGGRGAAAGARALQVALIALPAAFLVLQAPAVWATATAARTGEPNDVEQDAAFIASKTSPGEPVYIFALNQGTLYGVTKTRSVVKGPGLAEMMRKSDLTQAQNDIAVNGPDKVFVGTGLESSSASGRLGADIALDFKDLRKHYALAERGPGDRILFLRRRPFEGPDRFDETGDPSGQAP